MLIIKEAIAEDADAILKLAKELFADLGHQLRLSEQESLLFCKSILESGEYVAFLSYGSQGHANGIITLSEGLSIYAEGKFGIIREFYVIPEMRSTGVGQALLAKAKEIGRRNNWKRIEVTPPDKIKWPRTYGFYAREGFKEIGPRLKLKI